MTWSNRLRLLLGLILVVAVVGVLTMVHSQRKGETTSASATVEAVEYPVGTDYPGTVIEQFVVQGDGITAGAPIVRIQSNTLLETIRNGSPLTSNDVYDINADGTLTVKSTVTGIVEDLQVQQGGYAAGGNTIATIAATEGLYVEAEFALDPKDYARIEEGATVELELPSTERLDGTVTSFEVETVDGEAQAAVKIESDKLVFTGSEGLIAPGTPVVADMQLRHDDPLARAVASIKRVLNDVLDAVLR
jgi:multidrug resistance efflux pump